MEHIDNCDIDLIIDKILTQYHIFINLSKHENLKSLFLEEYAHHRKKHTLFWAIDSAFPSGNRIGNLYITCFKDSGGHTRPILYNDIIEICILNNYTDYSAKFLQERYSYNSNCFSNKKLFCYIKIHEKSQQITKIELCLPDENGTLILNKAIRQFDS